MKKNSRIRPAPTPGFGVGSERRRYCFCETTRNDENNDDGGHFLIQSVGLRGQVWKQRMLTSRGLLGDRPKPTQPRPQAAAASAVVVVQPKAQMPFLYVSENAGVVLTRGQYLDLKEAPAHAEARAKEREARKKAADDLVNAWRRDPRMAEGWTVHYNPKAKRCYFVETSTRRTQWTPPLDMPTKPPPKPKKPVPVLVDSCCVRAARHCWRIQPRPPRWWWSISRSCGTNLKWACSAAGLPSPCPCYYVENISFHDSNEDVQELVEALGLTQADLRELKAAFRDCDWDDGGDVSTVSFLIKPDLSFFRDEGRIHSTAPV